MIRYTARLTFFRNVLALREVFWGCFHGLLDVGAAFDVLSFL